MSPTAEQVRRANELAERVYGEGARVGLWRGRRGLDPALDKWTVYALTPEDRREGWPPSVAQLSPRLWDDLTFRLRVAASGPKRPSSSFEVIPEEDQQALQHAREQGRRV